VQDKSELGVAPAEYILFIDTRYFQNLTVLYCWTFKKKENKAFPCNTATRLHGSYLFTSDYLLYTDLKRNRRLHSTLTLKAYKFSY
jgi:hypothetical protein